MPPSCSNSDQCGDGLRMCSTAQASVMPHIVVFHEEDAFSLDRLGDNCLWCSRATSPKLSNRVINHDLIMTVNCYSFEAKTFKFRLNGTQLEHIFCGAHCLKTVFVDDNHEIF